MNRLDTDMHLSARHRRLGRAFRQEVQGWTSTLITQTEKLEPKRRRAVSLRRTAIARSFDGWRRTFRAVVDCPLLLDLDNQILMWATVYRALLATEEWRARTFAEHTRLLTKREVDNHFEDEMLVAAHAHLEIEALRFCTPKQLEKWRTMQRASAYFQQAAALLNPDRSVPCTPRQHSDLRTYISQLRLALYEGILKVGKAKPAKRQAKERSTPKPAPKLPAKKKVAAYRRTQVFSGIGVEVTFEDDIMAGTRKRGANVSTAKEKIAKELSGLLATVILNNIDPADFMDDVRLLPSVVHYAQGQDGSRPVIFKLNGKKLKIV